MLDSILRRGFFAGKVLAPAALCLVFLWGCPPAGDGTVCRISADCPGQSVCVAGACVASIDPDVGNVPDLEEEEGGCQSAPAPRRGQLILNEILAAVPVDDGLGDTNGDGVRDSSDDEFMEFVNVTDVALRIKGLSVFKGDDTEPVLVVESGCLGPKQSLVVFGGLEEGPYFPSFPNTTVEISQKRFGLTNSGLVLRVETSEGLVLFEGPFPGADQASVTLDPQLGSAFGQFVPHDSLSELPYSPGTCALGDAFDTGCPTPPPECPAASPAQPGDLLVNEVLSAVPADEVAGDANRDGVRSSSADEFIELVNVSNSDVLVRGLRVFKNDEEKSSLKAECLRPGQTLVVFGGLEPGASAPDLGQARVEISNGTWGFNNGGSLLRLVDSEDNEVLSLELPSASGESLIREVELNPESALVGHTQLAQALMSPGTCADGSPIAAGCPPPASACPDAVAPTAQTLMVNEVLAAVPAGLEGDANADGVRSASDDEFVEFVNIGSETLRVEGLRIFKSDDERAALRTECLAPGQVLVVFGGLESAAEVPQLGQALVEILTRTMGLTNGGTTLRVLDPEGREVLSVDLPASSGESLSRAVDLDPASLLVDHTALNPSALFSPGACASGGLLEEGCR